jgi:hypothetical protein
VPSRNGAAIVLVHGLLYDERGRGQSGGRSNAFGWDWPGDVDSGVSFLERQGVRHVGVLGLSTVRRSR